MKIIYKAEKGKTRIFGNTFVKNNKNKLKLVFNNRLIPFIDIIDFKNDEKQKIKLIELKKLSDLSFMFDGCNSLIEFSESSKNVQARTKEKIVDEILEKKLFIMKDDIQTQKDIIYQSFFFRGNREIKPISFFYELDKGDIKNMKALFRGCTSLSFLPDISKWNTNKIEDMSYMFSDCESLLLLPDISKWNINRVTNMSYLFNGCASLTTLPDISKWNTSNVTDMSFIFCGCSTLISLPDISKWTPKKHINLNYMFHDCLFLKDEFLIDYTHWNTNNFNIFKYLFKFFTYDNKDSLIKEKLFVSIESYKLRFSIPKEKTKIIKIFGKKFVENNKDKCIFFYHNTIFPLQEYLEFEEEKELEITFIEFEKVYDRSYMFDQCSRLVSFELYTRDLKNLEGNNNIVELISFILKDPNYFNNNHVTNISQAFNCCTSLRKVPAISYWNTVNVEEMSKVFNKCKSLTTLPDISKWNTEKVQFMDYMFCGCESLKSSPDISLWNTINLKSMNYMFKDCISLKTPPNICIWICKSLSAPIGVFEGCCNLESLPNLPISIEKL